MLPSPHCHRSPPPGEEDGGRVSHVGSVQSHASSRQGTCRFWVKFVLWCLGPLWSDAGFWDVGPSGACRISRHRRGGGVALPGSGVAKGGQRLLNVGPTHALEEASLEASSGGMPLVGGACMWWRLFGLIAEVFIMKAADLRS
jgi:hypothetical protein